jgi:hypothetical protein
MAKTPKASTGYPEPLFALDYFRMADEFFQAYRDLPPRTPPHWPRYLMACHAIELALKGYLLLHNVPETVVMSERLRHNLSALLAAAETWGLQIGTEATDTIKLLSEVHKDFRPRYPKLSGKEVLTICQCEPCIDELLKAVRPKPGNKVLE